MWVSAHRKNTCKKSTKDRSFSNQKIQKIVKDILKNKIEQIKKNTNLPQNILAQVKNRKRLFENRLQKIAKMQNLSQN